MHKSTNFQVYNASAGSGKTFTLVKEYLKVLLQSEDKFSFQKVLAITFTNKAAAEMKERVLHNLQEFSDGNKTDIYPKIIEETSLDKLTIKHRSKNILKAILQNYSAFSITTIDSFTHKIIKSFAYDLGLAPNFEVELDAETFLSQAVDVLISKIGIEKDITKALIDFSLEKVNEDKSWDISRDLNEFAKILLNEDDIPHFRALENKTLNDFIVLKNNLIKHQIQNKTDLQEIGAKSLALISSKGLEYGDFFKSIFPNFLVELTKMNSKFDYLRRSETIEKAIENHQFYTKSAKNEIISSIENILPELISLFRESQQVYKRYLLNKLALKSIVPLATLTKINAELTSIKEYGNIRLLSEFNQLISDEIKDQPAPFIYERIGQKFTHYFIDEMQDTSVLQWQNLVPLIANALSQENSNLLLVGDGKQAIYRWRGGKAEQFIDLGSSKDKYPKTNPFKVEKDIKELETNYRSYSEIIQFNNQFFQHISDYFQNQTYKQLFIDGNKQRETAKKGGYVSIDFLEKENDKEENDLKYAKKVLEIIRNLDSNFLRNEVCILVRKKKDAIIVANYLSENGIKIISSETLLLQNSEKVNFIIDLLQVIQHQNDEETLLDMLYFLYNHLKIETDQHLFYQQLIGHKNDLLFKKLSAYGISFDLKTFYQLSFYEKIEEIIRNFNLMPTSDAYLQFFLDVVFDSQRKGTSVQEFLDFWKQKKDNLSIVASESTDAVQIMTIHKSKGLEFSVVIFPYDINIYYQKDPKVWLGNLSANSHFGNFDELLISSSKDIKYVNDSGVEIYQKQREELELDSFNLLYVALTRSVEQLYIVAENRINAKGYVNINYSSGIFIEYLKGKKIWNNESLSYSFGNIKRVSKVKDKTDVTQIQEKFISTSWREHNIYMLANSSKLWDTTRGEAIEFGNLIHEMMAKIITEKDVEKVVSQYIQQGFVDKEISIGIEKKIKEIVIHPELSNYFSDDVTVFNERELLAENKQIVIPDRLVFNDKNEVVIIDYKTGKPSKSYHQQLSKYEQVLQSMGVKVIKKLLIYINDIITVEEN